DFLESPLADGLRRLPAVQAWLASDSFKGLKRALQRAETVLGENVATIRDDLLGEAFVLTLRIPPGGKPDDARGLLLVRAPKRALLEKLVKGLDGGSVKNGENV